MRLYPAAYMINRTAKDAVSYQGYDFAAGTTFFLPQYAVHRDPRYWESPERFDPERFAAGKLPALPPGAYFPFGGGPRACIGNHFALSEALLGLVGVLQKFRPESLPDRPFTLNVNVTMTVSPGVFLQFTRW